MFILNDKSSYAFFIKTRYLSAMYNKVLLIIICISLPFIASCTVAKKTPQQHASSHTDESIIADVASSNELSLADEVAPIKPSRTTNIILQGIRPDDIARAQASAKHYVLPHWPRIVERSALVRERIKIVIDDMQAPTALQLIPVVESGYRPYALSPTGAMGLWQLMPLTARSLGIKKQPSMDGRRHVEDSTRAAITYLQQQYERFGNWPLAFAAYNMGPNGLSRRLTKTPWTLDDGLNNMPAPAVTRTYVQHIIGLTALLDMHVIEFPESIKTRIITMQAPIDIKQLEKQANLAPDSLFKLNPALQYSQYLTHDVTLHVPENIADELLALNQQQQPKFISIRLQSGDSLWQLARHYHTTVRQLHKLNPNLPKRLKIGAKLTVPAHSMARATASLNPLLSQGRRIRYKVRKGDSLWTISKRFGTTSHAIARANQLSTHALIRPGDTLWILARIQPS